MDCKEAARLIEPYLDGELDRDEARALEAHVDGCAECRGQLEALGRLRHAVRTEAPHFAAPDSLRERLRAASMPAAEPRRPRRVPAWWRLAAACFVAFVAGGVATWSVHPSGDPTSRDLFASHWRALAAASPVDVISSDRHTVRPWFAGKLARAPLVRDFADQGFPLVGGRLDYAGDERVPVLVYRHDKHLIDVYVLGDGAGGSAVHREGYTLAWSRLDGQPAAIVSDLDAAELARFGALLGDAH
jgi:anti-sigma factor (TIGR02949 family)